MLALTGILLALAAVAAGFVLEKGNLWVLIQPAELLIVAGAGMGILITSNRLPTLKAIARSAGLIFGGAGGGRAYYLDTLKMLYDLFAYSRKTGAQGTESEAENPQSGQVLKNYPRFLNDKPAAAFLCESLRLIAVGATTPEELDELLQLDMAVQQHARQKPAGALSQVADSLPGLGIIAAVLGVVVTMQAIGGAPETVGQKVAAALVGTFLGILLCYGVVGPLATRLEQQNEARGQLFRVLRVALISHARGTAPMLSAEYARRAIEPDERPSFAEMERTVRGVRPTAPEPAQAGAQAEA